MSGDKDKPDAPPSDGKRPMVIDRGSISGSGKTMPDEKALELLRRKSNAPGPENPDIGVIVKEPTTSPGQTTIPGTQPSFTKLTRPIEKSYAPSHFVPIVKQWTHGHLYRQAGEDLPLVMTAYLDSTMGSILDQCPRSPSRKQPLVLRLFFDDRTVDLDLPEWELADPTITLGELVRRYDWP